MDFVGLEQAVHRDGHGAEQQDAIIDDGELRGIGNHQGHFVAAPNAFGLKEVGDAPGVREHILVGKTIVVHDNRRFIGMFPGG